MQIKLKKQFSGSRKQKGQAMLVFVLVLGATVLSVTAIAGYITLQKLRAATDIVDSTKSIYAADSGVEWCFYNKFPPMGTSTFVCDTSQNPGPQFTNNLPNSTVDVSVSESENLIKSIGHSGRSYRAFGIFLDQFNQ
jgi:hypothetical protein